VLKEETNDNSLVFKKCCFPSDSSTIINSLVVLQKLPISDNVNSRDVNPLLGPHSRSSVDIGSRPIISQTTEKRNDVINDKYAQFRADKLLVVRILSLPDLQDLDTCRSFRNFYFEYRKNEMVEAHDFETDIDVVSGRGIHYFKTVVAALNFGFGVLEDHSYYDGIWYNYNYNGKLLEIYNLKKGKLSGTQTMYLEDGSVSQYTK
jgi:hypothetical protein